MSPSPPSTDVWADDRIVVRRSSIAGSGPFAGDDIGEGIVVPRLGGRFVTSAELTALIAEANPRTGRSLRRLDHE